MKTKEKRESKISTPQTNTNKKKQIKENRFETAFFKKNEFALILIGALLLTVIIFFIFFNSSDPSVQKSAAVNPPDKSISQLEKRVSSLEESTSLRQPGNSEKTGALDDTALQAVEKINERVTRLETAFSLKFDTMIDRLETLEKKLAEKQSQSQTVKKTVVPVKKAVAKEKKKPLFHTVQKGETLYSISKKYGTTVIALRKLNNLGEKDKIYPGNNIIVR